MKKRPDSEDKIYFVDNMEEIISNLLSNINFNRLVYEFLEKDILRGHTFSSDLEKYHFYYSEVERNKPAYLDLLEVMRKQDEENKKIINKIINNIQGNTGNGKDLEEE